MCIFWLIRHGFMSAIFLAVFWHPFRRFSKAWIFIVWDELLGKEFAIILALSWVYWFLTILSDRGIMAVGQTGTRAFIQSHWEWTQNDKAGLHPITHTCFYHRFSCGLYLCCQYYFFPSLSVKCPPVPQVSAYILLPQRPWCPSTLCSFYHFFRAFAFP